MATGPLRDWYVSLLDSVGAAISGTNPLPVSTQPSATTFAVFLASSAGVKGTITQAAGGGTIRNVCTNVSFGFSTATAAPTSTVQVNVQLRDGATGAGTVKRAWSLVIPALSNINFNISEADLTITGSQNTAMTLEFQLSVANAFEYVNLSGYTIAS